MKKITQEEFESIARISKGRKVNEVAKVLLSMEVGEAMVVEKGDWTLKSPISIFLGNYRIRTGKQWKTKITERGCAVLRTK